MTGYGYVDIVCPNCHWRSHRRPKGCPFDHAEACACSLGVCQRCGSPMVKRKPSRRRPVQR